MAAQHNSIFTTLEAARAEVERLKTVPGLNKQRFIYTAKMGQELIYVVAQNVTYGRARAAQYWSDAIVVTPVGAAPKNVESWAANLTPEQMEQVKAIIAAKEAK